MRVGIASDHGGFILKEQIANLLRGAACEVVDFGALQACRRSTLQSRRVSPNLQVGEYEARRDVT